MLSVILQLQNQSKPNPTKQDTTEILRRRASRSTLCMYLRKGIGGVYCSLLPSQLRSREDRVNILGVFSLLFDIYLEVYHRPGSPVLERCEIVGSRRGLLFIIRTCTSHSPTQKGPLNHVKKHETKKWHMGNCTTPHHGNKRSEVGGRASSPSLLCRNSSLPRYTVAMKSTTQQPTTPHHHTTQTHTNSESSANPIQMQQCDHQNGEAPPKKKEQKKKYPLLSSRLLSKTSKQKLILSM